MIRPVLLILPAALLCLAAAPAPKALVKAAAPKTAPVKTATPTKPAPVTTAFNAQSPQGLMEILGAAGAKVQTNRREDDAVFVAVTSSVANFSMQFAGCDAQGRICKAVLLDSVRDRTAISGVQINAFNQTSVMCRIYQDKAGLPHILYSAILFKTMSREDAVTHLQAWQGCLADGSDFLKDPVTYLANAA